MSEWRSVLNEPPPLDVEVLAIHLNRYSNADWCWSEPRLLTRVKEMGSVRFSDRQNHSYQTPDLWMHVPLPPPIPDSPEREAARRFAAARAEYERRLAVLKQKFSVGT